MSQNAPTLNPAADSSVESSTKAVSQRQDVSTLMDTSDLNFFTAELDLVDAAMAAASPCLPLNEAITSSAHVAVQTCNAMSQWMLSEYEPKGSDSQKQARVKAEQLAFELGFSQFNGDCVPANPFEEPILAGCWEDGFHTAQSTNHSQPLQTLETKYQQQGINLETDSTRFELCALHLYRLSVQRNVTIPVQERARRLAMEMCWYSEGATPRPQRLQELDQFLQAQARRLAAALDL